MHFGRLFEPKAKIAKCARRSSESYNSEVPGYAIEEQTQQKNRHPKQDEFYVAFFTQF